MTHVFKQNMPMLKISRGLCPSRAISVGFSIRRIVVCALIRQYARSHSYVLYGICYTNVLQEELRAPIW